MNSPLEQLSTQILLGNIIESISACVFWKDLDGRYQGCNTAFAEEAGFSSPSDIIGKTDFDLKWKELAELYRNDDKAMIATGTPALYHEESQSSDGNVLQKASRLPLYDDKQNIIGILGVYEKRPEQKNIQHELALAKFVMDHAPLNITFLDEDGRIRYINKTGAATLGYSEEELLKMSVPDIDPLFPADAWHKHWQALKEHKVMMVETQHQTKSGTLFPIEVIANYIEFDGKAYNVAFDRDLTERSKTHKQLEASKKKFETLFNAATDGIAITSFEGEIIDVNTATYKRLGYSKDELISRSIADFTSKEDAGKALARAAELRKHGSMTFESITYKKDGTPLPVEITSSIIELEGCEFILNISRDISMRKNLEDQLVQAQKMESIGTLVGGIAHDFNNILAAIQGNLYLAAQHSQSDPVALVKLHNIETLSSRAAEMVQQLLTFARKDTVMMEHFSLNDFLNASSELLATSIPENIEHEVKICKEPLFIKGNATQIQQLLINLISNARDAVADSNQPKISCTLTPFTIDQSFVDRHPEQTHEYFARLTLKDNGCGIPAEVKEKIFEPFFTTKEVGQGTGLGLSMLYGAMQNHGGCIDVTSQVNKGTTFSLYFPISNEPPMESSSHSKIVTTAQEGTILLVDDEISMRETTAEVLRNMGYQVIEASNGERALHIYNTYKGNIDLILTDVVMPHMGGHALFAEIRKLNPLMPIILVTGYHRSYVLNSASKLEHFKIINKPFNFDALSQDIQDLIQAKH